MASIKPLDHLGFSSGGCRDREDMTWVSHEVSKTGLSSSEMSEIVAFMFCLPNIKCVYMWVCYLPMAKWEGFVFLKQF